MTTLKGIILFALGGLFVYSLLRKRYSELEQLDRDLDNAVDALGKSMEAMGIERDYDPFERYRQEQDARFRPKVEAARNRLSSTPAA